MHAKRCYIFLSSNSELITQNSALLAGGEGGIRTHGPIAETHAFQACRFVHSRTSPQRFSRGGILTCSLMTSKVSVGAHRHSVDLPAASLSHSAFPLSHSVLRVHIHSFHSETRPILSPPFCGGMAPGISCNVFPAPMLHVRYSRRAHQQISSCSCLPLNNELNYKIMRVWLNAPWLSTFPQDPWG